MAFLPPQTPPRAPKAPVKWVATVVQPVGYGLTGLNDTPRIIYAFIVGIAFWFAVGAMWNDLAIMVVRVGAFLSPSAGSLNG